jgi:hypothetical protein
VARHARLIMTALDNALKSKNLVIAFGGLVAAATAWGIWGSDMFPAEPEDESAKQAEDKKDEKDKRNRKKKKSESES